MFPTSSRCTSAACARLVASITRWRAARSSSRVRSPRRAASAFGAGPRCGSGSRGRTESTRRSTSSMRSPAGARSRPALRRYRASSEPVGRGAGSALGDGFELVADAVARLDECVVGRALVDLLSEAADEDIDRAVTVRLAPAPELLEELVAGRDAAALESELVEEPELRRRQADRLPVEVGLHLARVDTELLDLD